MRVSASLIAGLLLIDVGLALCQYPSIVGSLRVFELVAIEGQVALVFVVVSILRTEGKKHAAGVLAGWLIAFSLYGFLLNRRASEILSTTDVAVYAVIRQPTSAQAFPVEKRSYPDLRTENCHVVERQKTPLLARIDYRLHCDDGDELVVVYQDLGKVVSVWIP